MGHRHRSLLLLGCLGFLALGCAAPGRLLVVLHPADIERELSSQFPVTRDLLLVQLELAEPKVLLSPEVERIGVRMASRLTTGGLTVEGSVAVSGQLRYEPEQAAFFLDEPVVEDVQLPGLSPSLHGSVMEAANLAVRAALPGVPVYRTRGNARMMLKRVKVSEGKVVAELGL